MCDLHQEQLSHLADIAGTYAADPDDPTSLEVLESENDGKRL